MEDDIDCIMLDDSMVLNITIVGIPMSIPEEAITIDFHIIDNSCESNDFDFDGRRSDEIRLLLILMSSSRPSN